MDPASKTVTDALWEAVNELRQELAETNAALAEHRGQHKVFVQEFRESRKERNEQFKTTTAQITALSNDLHERKGMGRLFAIIIAGLTGFAAVVTSVHYLWNN